ncbi:2-oxoglutarate dehydrogenase E1 component [Sinimarinibacterium sp. NLF-5-8]|uniref:2-oxoglutarate dehydrogenase E1 component n=1 Tax=Sinimarinibacterium sp. NLF-5-8 TaxID=2698684 RepID=UPI00137C214F|nr:2-oxoglutarate dehydrogenase E1 component [Sinimarinibacterium sp. NLF-5-8]QHS08692.1 2-oxoglutarate dehydrogenase E1 component [Sinimarinibacterium sp. NLF-5-8]
MTQSKYQSFIESSSIQGANAPYVEAFYEQFLDDPESVSPDWRAYFRLIQDQNAPREIAHSEVVARFERLAREPHRVVAAEAGFDALAAEKQGGVLRLINYYRMRGHQVARLDPLGLATGAQIADLDPAFHGLGPEDMETVFNTGSLAVDQDRLPLKEIIRILKSVYTDTIGAEYMYLTETEQKRWIQKRLEPMAFQPKLSPTRKREVLHQLVAAEGLERYLHRKYVGQKRFSLEGGDSLIPAMDEILHACAARDVDEILIGMAHRGRLNVLINILGKAPKELFAEFEGKYSAEALQKAGDVKYHMGFSTDVEVSGKRLHLVLAFNPSHLEIVNPVVEGSAKARQILRGDDSGQKVVPVLIHGDAAFAGQGVVMETLQLSDSHGYGTGGTMHIIVNNQIGFTTPNPIEADPGAEARTSRYCTDLAKMLEAPVFHVNGDDPEAVVFVTRLAMDFRNEFNKDVIVDICCYRRLGHNEADEPSVTSPVMYEAIKHHPTTLDLYTRKLEEQGVLTKADVETLSDAYRKGLDQGENTARVTLGLVGNKHTIDWRKYRQGELDGSVDTTVTADAIRTLNDKLLSLPEGFTLHPRVKKIYEDRAKMAAGELPMDWGFAETMAYAALIGEGFAVRLSGQDARRGTFFHRHVTVHDYHNGHRHTPLERLAADKSRFDVNDSLLSEAGVLGFEYGYSTTLPDSLVIWEAQFGDFANGAQVLFDQFISSGYAKWGRLCGLVCFLPHGYEGQGPEHSSARLERYLQLCAENNQQVCVPSTPAQMFHMLRRQMKWALRLPLIVMTPKSLLRHPLSVSPLEDLIKGRFQPIIPEVDALDAARVTRIVFCSGKVYFDLYQAREKQALDHVALVRIEQLYPFPREEYEAVLAQYPNASEIVWTQEEPENQGAWYQIKHRLQAYLLPQHRMLYATRAGSATTAVGYLKVHQMQQEEVINAALTGGTPTA